MFLSLAMSDVLTELIAMIKDSAVNRTLTLWVLGGTPLKFGGQKMQPTLGNGDVG
jgi:hypothetical protein